VSSKQNYTFAQSPEINTKMNNSLNSFAIFPMILYMLWTSFLNIRKFNSTLSIENCFYVRLSLRSDVVADAKYKPYF
jgi:hypothetical protein